MLRKAAAFALLTAAEIERWILYVVVVVIVVTKMAEIRGTSGDWRALVETTRVDDGAARSADVERGARQQTVLRRAWSAGGQRTVPGRRYEQFMSKPTFSENIILHLSLFLSVGLISWLYIDRSPDLFAHRFYVSVLFFSVLVIPKCGRLSWPALWSTFRRTIK